MLGLTADPRATRDVWSDDNARGLAYAAVGAWSDAAEAFSTAAEVAAAPGDVASHEALALILNNLAQASFRAGRAEDGIRHAQRACSLRAALVGEDAIAVARARADLAVMLGAVGRTDEALGLMTRAIAGIERSAGDEDLRLSSVLENAARLAMVAGQPSTAEPYLIRLHALLAAHELPTDTADVLLRRVAQYREPSRLACIAEREVPAAPVVDVAETTSSEDSGALDVATAHVADAADADVDVEYAFDDQPLRDAVRVTDELLRSTPTSSRAITPLAVMEVEGVESPEGPELVMVEVESAAPAGVLGLDFDLVDDVVGVAEEMVTGLTMVDESIELTESPRADDIFGHATFDLVEPSAAGHTGHGAHASTSVNNVLGFVVEYGMPSESSGPDLADLDILVPPTASHVPTPTEMRAVQPRTTPRGTPIVMPSPASSHRAFAGYDTSGGREASSESEREARAPRLTLHNTDDLDRERRIRRPNIRAGRASAPRSSRGLMIAGVVTSVIAASVGWLVWSGGM
ncbi:MAG: tetratricopeptide repeat protein [Gemmatimonadaceae bacterium]|nr:tetratricopeptide repeat protein [Gemmatimonadaceae bacterium]